MPITSISSCWNSHRHTCGYAMLCELADLGFEYAELSHGIRISLVEGILRALKEGVIKISTVHNFCPLPPHITHAAPNLYEPTAPGEHEIQLWKRNTLKTFDFAVRVGARLVVIHSGSARFFWGDPGAKLDDECDDVTAEEIQENPKVPILREKLLKKMRKKQPTFISQLIECYSEFIPHAAERGLKMGIENREGFTELPLDEDMAGLLDNLGHPETIGYWHDAGHAQIKERCGFIGHEQLLTMNSARQFGFHLHDVSVEGRDHRPLGTGTIDFEMVKSFIRDEHICVLELSPRLSTEEVEHSRDFFRNLMAD